VEGTEERKGEKGSGVATRPSPPPSTFLLTTRERSFSPLLISPSKPTPPKNKHKRKEKQRRYQTKRKQTLIPPSLLPSTSRSKRTRLPSPPSLTQLTSHPSPNLILPLQLSIRHLHILLHRRLVCTRRLLSSRRCGSRRSTVLGRSQTSRLEFDGELEWGRVRFG